MFEAQKITGMIDFELDDIPFRGDAVFFFEQSLKIGFAHAAGRSEVAQREVCSQKIIADQVQRRLDLLRMLLWLIVVLLEFGKDP